MKEITVKETTMTKNTIQLEAGKTYLTRNGKQVVVEAISDPDDFYRFRGKNHGPWYSDDGRLFSSNYENGSDLVATAPDIEPTDPDPDIFPDICSDIYSDIEPTDPDIEALLDAAQQVVDCWDQGNLAAAVRRLQGAIWDIENST